MKQPVFNAIKAAAGCVLAIFLAQRLGLEYPASAGIILLLSLQDTKKETLRTAARRFLAFLAAVLFAFISFRLLGFTLWGLALYLLFFVFLCHAFTLQNAIAMCTVLVTHFWTEKSMSPALVFNEFLLVVLGAGIGILLNLFMSRKVGLIREKQREIEAVMRTVLEKMAKAVTGEGPAVVPELPLLGESLALANQKAVLVMNNTLTQDMSYYADYIAMRKNQYIVLRRIQVNLERLKNPPEQAWPVAYFFREIAASFYESNNAEKLLAQSNEIRDSYREQPLPQTREEFEARAILFQILNDLEHFLLLKNTFAQKMTDEQKRLFWGTP